MTVRITIRNYRCFGQQPTAFDLRKGIIAVVGANNSGKSTLLRLLYELRPIFVQLQNSHSLVQALQNGFDVPSIPSVRDLGQLFHKGSGEDIKIIFAIDQHDDGHFGPAMTIEISRDTRKVRVGLEDLNIVEVAQLQLLSSNLLGSGGAPIYDLNAPQEMFKRLAKTLYIGPFRSIAELGITGDYYDLKVGQAFVQLWNQIKTGDNPLHADISVNVRRDIQRLFKFSDFEINATADRQSLQIVTDEGSFKIHELGSGLAQFILVFAHAAIADADYIFIDEPESNLHASMQLSFVTSLAKYARQSLVYSSHNLGLARSTADVIFALERDTHRASVLKNFEALGPLSELVGELNFSAYQQLGFSTLLLVEGVTEVKAIQQFLRMLKIEQKVLLVPLFGQSMINAQREAELRELLRITNCVYALIDSEKPSATAPVPKARTDFKKLCDKIGVNCHILEYRALENYFPQSAVQALRGSDAVALGRFDDVKQIEGWIKADNWRIAQAMKLSDLEETDLGKFLHKIESAVRNNSEHTA